MSKPNYAGNLGSSLARFDIAEPEAEEIEHIDRITDKAEAWYEEHVRKCTTQQGCTWMGRQARMAALAEMMSGLGSPHVAPMPSSLISRLRRSSASASACRSSGVSPAAAAAAAASESSVFRRLRSGPEGVPSSSVVSNTPLYVIKLQLHLITGT